MESLLAILVAATAIVAFDMLAIRFGADSRDPMGDDHAR
jgi:hypothetical protein